MKTGRTVIYAGILLASLGALALAIFALSRRGPAQPTPLPFSTLAQEETFSDSSEYRGKEPGLLIIAGPEQIENPGLIAALPPDLAEKLRALDYRRSFALFVFQGLKGVGGYKVTVQEVVRQGNQVTVRAEFVEPGPRVRGVITSPYHLIAIEKEGRWEARIQFILLRNDETVAETTSTIP